MSWVMVLALLLLILGFFSARFQAWLRNLLHARPRLVWVLPPLLTAVFAIASLLVHVVSVPLFILVLAYTIAPVVCVSLGFDFLAVLFLWLPLEFSAGGAFVPRPAQGFLHSVAYGIAILLGLTLFLCYRSLPGMKYNLPRQFADLWLPLAAFALTAPVLAAAGIAIGFIPPPHFPTAAGSRMATAAGLIFVGTALPEEILFRSLIQNLLMKRFGFGWPMLLVSALIFGAAHLDNGPQPLPNWRYMILATMAGVAYGKVFQRASSVTSSALLHTMVDFTKHFFF
jgi:hypothetical protein